MATEKAKTCKTKGCNNPVLDGKYCEHCKQVRKENKNKGLAIAGGIAIPAVGVAIKKGALKQVPKIAKAVAQIILRK